MAKPSPLSQLTDFFQQLPLPDLPPPAWALSEMQHRLVLLLNHVLQQENEAMARLARYSGRVMLVQWRAFSLKLQATPAGLLDLGRADAKPELVLTLTQSSPLALAQAALRADKSVLHIEGDVQLAAQVNWLAEHVRWDLEEDLSRVMGDVAAHTLSQLVQALLSGLRQFANTASVAGRSAL